MKLAFSTLGCPSWSFSEICSTAKDLGYDAVEIRGIDREMYAPDIKAFNAENLAKTKERLARLNLNVCMLTSGATLAVYGKKEEAVAEVKAYIDLAQELNAPYVRVMCTDQPYPDGGDLTLAKKLYAEVCEYGQERGVTPLMETNGLFADTGVLAEFLDGLNVECGALWDINHPYRFMNESVETTIKNLGSHIKHVHLKDSVVTGSRVQYKMPGMGDLPIERALTLLKEAGYDGYYSLEWVKRWNQELEEPGIVFSHFVSYMQHVL